VILNVFYLLDFLHSIIVESNGEKRFIKLLKFEVGGLIKVEVSSGLLRIFLMYIKSLSKIPASATVVMRIRAGGEHSKNRANKVKTVMQRSILVCLTLSKIPGNFTLCLEIKLLIDTSERCSCDLQHKGSFVGNFST